VVDAAVEVTLPYERVEGRTSSASEPRDRSAPAERRARERVGESEGRRPSDENDVDLARLCAAGDERAWERFVREYRPILYRAADALDATGGAREVADSLYADLYGLASGGGERQSLLRYFHGRSSLATWLRAVLAQRYVDRLRAARRLAPLPDAAEPEAPAAADPDRDRYVALVRGALGHAVARLDPRDRLRLASYYVQELTLAQIGRLLRESEASASRHLARTRREIRSAVERQLREESRLDDDQIAACLASVIADSGPLDMKQVIYD
jgi:RNA polymerase sigma factor (sigma-70 family)